MNIFKLIKRILVHKYYVAKYCFQIGLYWQGIIHDMSKFSYTEFSGALKYWHDSISSLNNEKNILGYSATFLHHRGRNPHHYEYWIHSLDDGGIAAKMPLKYAKELICDYLAAAKTYGSSPRNEINWWLANAPYMKMHIDTKQFITRVFTYYNQGNSLKQSINKSLYGNY